MIGAKLDRILAGQEKQDRALADLEIAFGAVVQGVSGLVPAKLSTGEFAHSTPPV